MKVCVPPAFENWDEILRIVRQERTLIVCDIGQQRLVIESVVANLASRNAVVASAAQEYRQFGVDIGIQVQSNGCFRIGHGIPLLSGRGY